MRIDYYGNVSLAFTLHEYYFNFPKPPRKVHFHFLHTFHHPGRLDYLMGHQQVSFVQHMVYLKVNHIAQGLVRTLDTLLEQMKTVQKVVFLLKPTETVIFEGNASRNYDVGKHPQEWS